MADRDIDTALSKLVQLSWKCRHNGAGPGIERQVEAQAGTLLRELPVEYRDFVKTVSQEAAQALAMRPAAVASLPGPEAGPAEPPPIPEGEDLPDELVEETAPEPAPGMGLLAERLPVRNQAGTAEPHVQLFTEHNGLVHGGTIHIGSSKLVCRAFRFFNRQYDRHRTRKGPVQQTDVVAGVCEQFDASGRLVQRWTTAQRLPQMYQSTSVPLPNYACRYTTAANNLSGFYIGQGLPFKIRVSIRRGKGVVIDAPDDGAPDAHFYRSKYGGLFNVSAPPETAVENPFYNEAPIGTSGYVVKTPYLSIFSPDPDLPTVIVSMISVFREGEFTEFADDGVVWATKVTKFERPDAQFEVRSFKLE